MHLVLSGDGSHTYTVRSEDEIVSMSSNGKHHFRETAISRHVEHTCTCKAFAYHKNACKHIVAVRIALGLMAEDTEAKHTIPVLHNPEVTANVRPLTTICLLFKYKD
tara:strand:+ start:425 stop:745 length:321 start_codon:yes stop_codon:yes gene_type:complete